MADAVADGSGSFGITGTSPKGEEETLQCCMEFIRYLCSQRAQWGDPKLGNEPADCVSTDPSGAVLEMQLTAAIADPTFWAELGRGGNVDRHVETPELVAAMVRNAIEEKASPRRIPPSLRQSLVLVLNALRLPFLCLDPVKQSIKSELGVWTATLGFKEVWIVGPTPRMIWRLDAAV